MSALVDRAGDWVREVHPHARHLERTLDWVVELDPQASEALRIAAVTHDIERAFPEPGAGWDSARDWRDPAYNRWHQDRCADIVADWLREQEATPALTERVEQLVRVHEQGGWPEADLLQAADSLSFLDTMVPLVLGWAERGHLASAAGKLRDSVERIAPQLERARALAAPRADAALRELVGGDAERGVLRPGTPAAQAAAPAREAVLAATRLVRDGRVFRLARERFPGMPLFPGHPPFQVLSYRTPQGIRAAGDRPWGPRARSAGRRPAPRLRR